MKTTIRLTFIAILTIVTLCSCNQNSKATAEVSKSTNPLKTMDSTIIQPKSENRKIPKSWKSLGSIQQSWIEVEKDKNGYFISQPCNGKTPTLKLVKGDVVVESKQSTEGVYLINKFTRTTSCTGLMIDVYPGNGKEIDIITAQIIEPENGIVLWTIGNQKMLMTPVENAVNFRQIKYKYRDESHEQNK